MPTNLSQDTISSTGDIQYVDPDRRIIAGYAVMSVGEAKGHEVRVDETTIDQIVELGNQPNKGIKVRWTHPSVLQDGMGKYLGRATNFRKSEDGQKALADMIISESSFDTPLGNLGGYVLQLAQEDPEAFGTSAVIQYSTIESEDVGDLPVIRVIKLYASDVVDEPAANNGLFSAASGNESPENLEALLSSVLDEAGYLKSLELLHRDFQRKSDCGTIDPTSDTTQNNQKELSVSTEDVREEAEALEAAMAVVEEKAKLEAEVEVDVQAEAEVVDEAEADAVAGEVDAEAEAEADADAEPQDAEGEPEGEAELSASEEPEVSAEDAPAEALEEGAGEPAGEAVVEDTEEDEEEVVEEEAADGAAEEAGESAELSAEELTAQVLEAERKRVKEVRELCEMAGHASLSASFIDAGLSAAETREKLFEAMCKGKSLGVADGTPAQPADPHASYRAEYRAAVAELGDAVRYSEDDYVKSRIQDDSQYNI